MGTFNRETDIAWDAQDNMYVSDGYGNSRFVKIAKDGTWVKAVGTHGSGPDQFSTVHSIAADKETGLVYVADRGNQRIQVYDTDMNFKKSITGISAPWSIQVTPKYMELSIEQTNVTQIGAQDCGYRKPHRHLNCWIYVPAAVSLLPPCSTLY